MIYLINPVYYQDYILSGKPEFIIASTKNKIEETFVVKKYSLYPKWFVNNRLRHLLGYIQPVPDTTEDIFDFVRIPPPLGMSYQETQVKQFTWFWSRFLQGTLPKYIEVRYTGRCGHCGRELTHPESLPIGIGPDCFKKLGLSHKKLIKDG